ncbi:DNRLRE domain-containing protein [Candidatus Woesearchaeota archaeon]|nr:MAG: Metallophosphoesterase [archaeon GW2011_AR4]MBS3129440.1 DNRLRE domain-containing protein [Candidatus Woesearchaeota archaeon]HIH38481.1 DNRLRE domain-containing protein [Candidatus Woesearchaeota archaeon]HIH49779.1 DNRLRE domain-containing protein [Candidatus Woesearchaeota archaeon]HIJ03494.1 DNRLRE domain-containing protein [Candidatus Woesearchaeota archaeon]
MKTKNLLIVCILLIPFVSASLDPLIASYNFDFSSGVLDVTSTSQFLTDSDNNGVNDTLTFNITTAAGPSQEYTFLISLFEGTDLVQNYSVMNVSTIYPSAQVSFPTIQLVRAKYNYSLMVYDGNSLVYMDYASETIPFGDVERGNSIDFLSDAPLGDTGIQLNVTFNVSVNQTENITAFLSLGNYSTEVISSGNLLTPQSTISLTIDNLTITASHYSGVIIIDAIKVGEKVYFTNYSTVAYNYEDFAQYSYIQSVTTSQVDINDNNLSEVVQLNLTVQADSGGIYTLSSSLFDPEKELLIYAEINVTLTTGQNQVFLNFSGEKVYSSYQYGDFTIPLIELSKNGQSIDSYPFGITLTDLIYTEFEPPDLPDLQVNLSTHLDLSSNITFINITVSNNGSAPAFNIFLDVFDDSNFSYTLVQDSLNSSEQKLFNLTKPFYYTNNNIMVIVDMENIVDESYEENNIIDNFVGNHQPIALPSQHPSYFSCTVYTPCVFYCDYSDEDNDTRDTTIIKWFINDELALTNYSVNGIYELYLDPFYYKKGDTLKFECQHWDQHLLASQKENFSVYINNSLPFITTNISIMQLYVDQNFTFDFNASDPDVEDGIDILVWSQNLSFMSLNSSTGLLSGIPNESNIGNYSIQVSVSDGDDIDYKNISVWVSYPPNITMNIKSLQDDFSIGDVVGITDPPSISSKTNEVATCVGHKCSLSIFNAGLQMKDTKNKLVDYAQGTRVYPDADDIVIEWSGNTVVLQPFIIKSKKKLPVSDTGFSTNITYERGTYKTVHYIEDYKDIKVFGYDIISSVDCTNNDLELLCGNQVIGFDILEESGFSLDVSPTRVLIYGRNFSIIDPTMQLNYTSDIHDAMVKYNNPDTNYDAANLESSDRVDNQRESILRWNLSSIPPGSTITNASLYMMVRLSSSSDTTYGVRGVGNDSWIESSITWNTKPSYETTPYDTVDTTPFDNGDWMRWNITSLAQESADSDKSLSLAIIDEVSGGTAAWGWYDSETTTASRRPYLTIDYEVTPEENQSRIKNEGNSPLSIYLLMKMQFFNESAQQWVDVMTTYSSNSTISLEPGEIIKLDENWTLWNTSTINYGSGTYRAFVDAHDSYDSIIYNNEGNPYDSYNFSLS